MFHLGTLSYLNRIKLPNGKTLLEVVNTISTISGGSITGLWYMMHFCKGNDINKCFKDFFHILCHSDLPQSVLDSFLKGSNTNCSLIREMIRFYDEVFFNDQTFGLLLENAEKLHIHHFSANGTDFSNGLAFRFQASCAIQNAKPEFRYGFIGNKRHNIPRNIAAKIKLSEILAVSSCFPGAFEPMRYPVDFALYRESSCQNDFKDEDSFDLMDGGIVDNQGIEPLILANQQMSYDNPAARGEKSYPCHDLIIVSDVASPNIPQNKKSKMTFPMEQMTIHKIRIICVVAFVVSILLTLGFVALSLNFLSGMAFTFSILLFLVLIGFRWLNKILEEKLKGLPIKVDVNKLNYLTFAKCATLIATRATSLLTLAQSVFMKPIRQMRYNALYENPIWKNRLISNNVIELSSNGSWSWKKNLTDYLKPSKVIKENSDKASNMGTTLWFTKSDKEQKIPEALFMCGQYTICMNLLEYIEKLKCDQSNTTDAHKQLMGCESQLRNDWEQFQTTPDFLLNSVR